MARRAGAILAVADVDRSVAFYRDRIGFEVEALYDSPPYATLILAGTRLSLAEQGHPAEDRPGVADSFAFVRDHPGGSASVEFRFRRCRESNDVLDVFTQGQGGIGLEEDATGAEVAGFAGLAALNGLAQHFQRELQVESLRSALFYQRFTGYL